MAHLGLSSTPHAHLWTRLRLALCVLLLGVIAACGGGGSIDLSGGVGSGGSGVAQGSVTGFGSIYVDGVEYDDSNATSQVLDADGNASVTDTRLGQQVRVEQSTNGVAKTILVLPQLRGPVTAALQDGWLRVLDQWVQIVDAGSTTSTATVLDGYAAASAIAVGDAVEVHGLWRDSGGTLGQTLTATRVEKLSATPASLLIGGTVVQRNGNDVRLNNASGTVLRSDAVPPASVQIGTPVKAWVLARDWNAVSNSNSSSNPNATSKTLPVQRLTDDSVSVTSGQSLALGQLLDRGAVQNGVLSVQGLQIRVSDDVLSKLPAQNSLVQLQVRREGDAYTLTTVTQPPAGAALPGELIELKGSIVWRVGANVLRLRDTEVRVNAASLSPSCATVPDGAWVYVSIQAPRPPPGMMPNARSVQCQAMTPNDSVLSATAVLQAVAPDGRNVTLRLGQQSLVLQVVSASVVPPDLQRWVGRSVDVQYQNQKGTGNLPTLRVLKAARN